MSTAAFLFLALLTLAAATVALALRNIVRSILLLVASWFGLAAFYLWAGADFVAFAQVLVYGGAISMVTLFAVLLTRRDRDDAPPPASLARAAGGLAAALAVFGVLGGVILAEPFAAPRAAAPVVTVRDLGRDLAGPHAAALLVTGLILTVALLGAVVLAAADRPAPDDAP